MLSSEMAGFYSIETPCGNFSGKNIRLIFILLDLLVADDSIVYKSNPICVVLLS
jgi:hypothetical protein